MKKLLLISMLVLSSLSFAARGDHGGESGDFYGLYNSAYEGVGNSAMHKELGMASKDVDEAMSILNKGWYEIKVLEADKLKEVFAIDMLLVDGPGNQKKVEGHLNEINKISAKMDKVYSDTKAKLDKIMNVDKLK